jgi:hypothetical protein
MMRSGWLAKASLMMMTGVLVLLPMARTSLAQPPACVGDCDESGMVTIDDILILVNIALGTANVDDCQSGDADGSGDITIEEILQGVNNAQIGCPATPTPTVTASATPTGPTPTPTATPTLGRLGMKHFVLDPRNSQFRAAIAPGFVVPLGPFRGQTNGVVGDAYFDLQAGQPDTTGLATVDVVGSSEYIFADASSFAPLVICIRPILPVTTAGLLDCTGTLDFSIVSTIDHNIGQVGVGGFTAQDCTNANGTIEGANEICAAGMVGQQCFANSECDSSTGAGDGMCGLMAATCSMGKTGDACHNDSECDSAPDAGDGVCGTPAAEGQAGVCNGPVMFSSTGDTNRPGELSIAPVSEFGLNGLPVELTLENAQPCGDEGPGLTQAFAMTTAESDTTVLNFNNGADDFPFKQRGLNFSCRDWANSPGKFVLSFAVLNQFNGGDVITGFEFGSSVPTPTPTQQP